MSDARIYIIFMLLLMYLVIMQQRDNIKQHEKERKTQPRPKVSSYTGSPPETPHTLLMAYFSYGTYS